LIATYVATVTGLLFVSFKQKINLLDRVIITWLGGITAAIGLLLWYLSSIPKEQIEIFSKVSSNMILFGLIISFLLGALRKS
jgi:hypothetical protein